jgi:mRNA-degrading endonuclease toxin of MazEF toxin-antitoxin module
VAPLSASIAQAARGLSVVPIPAGTAGLKQESAAICPQTTTIDREKLADRIGELDFTWLRGTEDGLKAAMDLP